MKRLLTIIFVSFLLCNTNYSPVLAHHANEKYCFDCMHKYKIGDKKNVTYKLETDLKANDLSKTVEEQLKNKKSHPAPSGIHGHRTQMSRHPSKPPPNSTEIIPFRRKSSHYRDSRRIRHT